ncbi:MAG: hypothetical protein QOJ12_193 [Thermoleophilales bacterium]|nr:hypothetical protein [Thermoleophilales bacterium]
MLVTGLFPATAGAATFCVADASCSGNDAADVAAALSAAQANGSGLDRIQIGPGTFNASGGTLTAGPANPVVIDGAGDGATTLTRAAAINSVVLSVSNPQSVVSDLAVYLPSGPPGMSGVQLSDGALGERLRIAGPASLEYATGARVVLGSTLTRSVVTLPTSNGANYGVELQQNGRVLESAVGATLGVRIRGTGSLTRSVRIKAHVGVQLDGSAVDRTATVENTQVTSLAPAAPADAAITIVQADGAAATLNARHVTLVGPGAGTGVHAAANSFDMGAQANANVSDSLIRGYALDAGAEGGPVGTGTVTLSTSAFDFSKTSSNTSLTSINNVPGNIDLSGVDPRLQDVAGDMRPAFNSPLIDRGVPGAVLANESPVDLAGLPRVVDGDGSGGARRDMGAFEYQRSAPVVTAGGAPADAKVGEPFSFSASSTDADPGETPATITWAFDDGATAAGASVQHAFATPGRHTATATAVDPAGVAGTATVTVDVALPDTQPPAALRDVTAPALVIGNRTLRLTGAGFAVIPLTCPASEVSGPCEGTLKLRTARKERRSSQAKRKIIQFGSVAFSVPAGTTGQARVRLTKVSRRFVARRKRVQVVAAASVRDGVGNAGNAAATFTLAPPKSKPRR